MITNFYKYFKLSKYISILLYAILSIQTSFIFQTSLVSRSDEKNYSLQRNSYSALTSLENDYIKHKLKRTITQIFESLNPVSLENQVKRDSKNQIFDFSSTLQTNSITLSDKDIPRSPPVNII